MQGIGLLTGSGAGAEFHPPGFVESRMKMRGFFSGVVCLCLFASPCGAAGTKKLAGEGRFDLAVGAELEELPEVRVTAGRAEVQVPTWLEAAEQKRSRAVVFSMARFATNTVSVAFTPQKSGSVTLLLNGPWEEESKGTLYVEEVLWDSLRVSGATMGNDAWTSRPKPVKTWHNGSLPIPLQVSAGLPVTLQFQARPVVPESYGDMKRIRGTNTPAHRAMARYRKGANLGNYLEAPRGADWGARYTEQDFRNIKAEGFDHVRLPIAWPSYAGPAPHFKLEAEIWNKTDFLVTNALRNGLNVMLNIHHFDDFTSDPAGRTDEFIRIWEQLSHRYPADFAPESLVFELLNEPKDAATTAAMNPIYAEAVRAIRRENPKRTIFLGPGRWNQIQQLTDLLLPDEDENLVVTVHCYEPYYFTHQGATWSGPDVKTTGIVFPGPPATPVVPDPALGLSQGVLDWIKRHNTLPSAENPSSRKAFEGLLRLAHDWSEYYGRPIHVGEFGCFEKADPASRARFYREFRETAEGLGLGWAVWDWKAGFRYWDSDRNRPVEGMREALFGGAVKKAGN